MAVGNINNINAAESGWNTSVRRMSGLTRDGTAKPVSRDQILRGERGQGNIHFSLLISRRIGNIPRLIHTLLQVYDIRRYFQHAHFIPLVGVGKRGEY